MKYILAHDLGTSGNKATLFPLDGSPATSSLFEYPTNYPFTNAVEQDPNDWWKAVCVSSQRLLEKTGANPNDIAGMSFTGQGMACLMVDRDGNPLENAMIWADSRSIKEEAEIERRIGKEKFYRTTGHRISASYAPPKLMWAKENNGDAFRKTYKILQPKDYIILKLTGNFVSEYSDANMAGLLDINNLKWAVDILKELGIPEGILPDLYPSTAQVGKITEKASREIGLPQGIPVIAGGGDGSCSTAGAGVYEEGSAYAALGSSSWICMATKEPFFDPQMRTFNLVHLDSKLITPCGTMQAAGFSYNWYRGTFFKKEAEEAKEKNQNPYEIMDKGVLESVPGAGGLFYLPYLLGERSPWWNLDARGAIIGLSMTSKKEDVSRAILEGVAMNLKIILDILETQENAANPEKITMIGGGAKGKVWLQIFSDVWQKKLDVPHYTDDATSLGAAICGGVGVGAFKDFSEAMRLNPVREVIIPNKEFAPRYKELYSIFTDAYSSLTGVYKRLAAYRMENA